MKCNVAECRCVKALHGHESPSLSMLRHGYALRISVMSGKGNAWFSRSGLTMALCGDEPKCDVMQWF